MKFKDWENEIEGMDEDEVERLIDAFETLELWETLHKEFEQTGIFTLSSMLLHRLDVLRKG